MRISSLTVGGGASLSNGQKNQIKKQIRDLEKRKDELLKKLGVSTGGSGSGMSFSSASIAAGSFALAKSGAGDEGESASSPVSAFREMSASFQQFRQSLKTDNSDAVPTENEDPKEIIKQIMSIDMLLITLRQQLGEEYTSRGEDDEEEEGGHGQLAAEEAAPTDSTPAAEAPAVQVGDGHVDGYA